MFHKKIIIQNSFNIRNKKREKIHTITNYFVTLSKILRRKLMVRSVKLILSLSCRKTRNWPTGFIKDKKNDERDERAQVAVSHQLAVEGGGRDLVKEAHR
jgi:hypothetical protein